MKNGVIKNLTLTAMFLAIGLELPFLTGQIQQIGNMLLPMHIPVFLCALICGWKYGLPMAFILPLLRSFMFGRPALYPNAIGMAFELAAYAFVAGFHVKIPLAVYESVVPLYVDCHGSRTDRLGCGTDRAIGIWRERV